ncbi:hypothetical protein ACIP29_33080 [Streptomyces coelicoflavus]|uniref:hypothetical protein n=1 Tax=Streptomyces coelicoflavus TaxID=285562 RepID=UPI00382C64D5
MRRILIAGAAAVGLLLGMPGAANAHDTDDWYDVGSVPSGYGYVGSSSSHVGGVYQQVRMWRSNNYVVLSGYVSDTKTDGYCGTAQIRYEIYDNGGWVGHSHYRRMPVHDCTTGTTGDGHWKTYVKSTYKVRNVSARACHANSSGGIIHCESGWHGPI